MTEFQKVRLGDFIEILTDYHANGSYEVLEKNITLKRNPDFAVMIRTLNFERSDFKDQLIYLNKTEYEYLSKTKVYPDDILMNKIANPGTVYLMPDLEKPVSLAMNLFLIRFNSKMNQQFMYYLMKNNEKYIKRLAGGTTTHTIRKDVIRDIEFMVPPKSKQDSIAVFLTKLNSKIELNNKINEKLEAIANLIYDYWFVQFDFPDKNSKPYKSSGGKMVYNKNLKKEVPFTWAVRNISEIMQICSGYPFKSTNYLDSGTYKIVTIKNVQDNILKMDNTVFVNSLPSDIDSSSILSLQDILISLTGNVGRICLVDEKNLLLNQRVGKFKTDPIFKNYFYLTYRKSDFRSWLERISNGTSQKNLSPIEAVNRLHAFPDSSILIEFDKLVGPMIKKILSNLEENRRLESLRNWLLPMLMNGQVTVSSKIK